MKPCPEYVPGFDSLKCLLLDLAQERSLDALLKLAMTGLAEQTHVALARVWLIAPGDICPTCPMRRECPDQRKCLHLVASAGTPRDDPSADWSRTSGRFRRMPLGVRKVGRVGARGEAITVMDTAAGI